MGPSGIELLTIRIQYHSDMTGIESEYIFSVDILGVDCSQNIISVLLMVFEINKADS